MKEKIWFARFAIILSGVVSVIALLFALDTYTKEGNVPFFASLLFCGPFLMSTGVLLRLPFVEKFFNSKDKDTWYKDM
jgi:hypothetical protein